ncbi:MAG: hypothetical protein U0470_06595 [Anaerolineae bacterium]
MRLLAEGAVEGVHRVARRGVQAVPLGGKRERRDDIGQRDAPDRRQLPVLPRM